jgi:hypothetical protein
MPSGPSFDSNGLAQQTTGGGGGGLRTGLEMMGADASFAAPPFDLPQTTMTNVLPGEFTPAEQQDAEDQCAVRRAAGYAADGTAGGAFSEGTPPPGMRFKGYAKGCTAILWGELCSGSGSGSGSGNSAEGAPAASVTAPAPADTSAAAHGSRVGAGSGAGGGECGGGEQEVLGDGVAVELHSQLKPSLNGKRGVIKGKLTKIGRWTVVLEGTGKSVVAKPTHLRCIPGV